ncbi:phosphatase [Gordonia iterans]|uniref:Phosphatase n=1 Tax=Gordonia iterans TaxID=1004901 RepID=A0A2S0KKD4_9ACTN|nr:HAD-IA family hydrolase [Gordonia iterans]AVM02133.1 phosphatase [Gordonia iterans]
MRFEVVAILFDIDGTLVDSTPAVVRTWEAFADARSLDVEEILRISHGRRTEDTLADLLPASEVPDAAAQLEALELDDLGDVVALPAAHAVLSRLPADRWAAVTSGSQRLMPARPHAAGLPVPSVLIAAEDVEHGKPDPQGYRAAAAALGVDPDRCLVVEDAPAGIEAGRASGAAVLAVATSHDRSALSEAEAVVEDMRALAVSTP